MEKHPDDLLTGDSDPFKGDPNFMASLARGLEVIQAFTPQRPLLSISQISQKTGIPRAAVRRCLYTLSKLGFVYAEDGKNFQLRPKILALGHAWLASTPLARSAQPVLKHLSEMLNESCSIATLDGDDILYIARASSSRIMTIDLDIGSRLPAWAKVPCCLRRLWNPRLSPPVPAGREKYRCRPPWQVGPGPHNTVIRYPGLKKRGFPVPLRVR